WDTAAPRLSITPSPTASATLCDCGCAITAAAPTRAEPGPVGVRLSQRPRDALESRRGSLLAAGCHEHPGRCGVVFEAADADTQGAAHRDLLRQPALRVRCQGQARRVRGRSDERSRSPTAPAAGVCRYPMGSHPAADG